MERRRGPDDVTHDEVTDEVEVTDDEVTATDALRALPQASHEHVPATDGLEDPDKVLAVGSLVGERYVIEEHISSGGFGAVYRASDREIRHHQVALKLLHRPAASGDERKAALRELKLLATVTHPSVVQFKEYGWHEGRLWFAMPWYRGRTLDRLAWEHAPRGGMSRAEARHLFTRLAHGLAAMHATGVHHHDIKPENIFVAQIAGFPGGLPVLLDLGIATQRGENPVGLTVDYASPETAAAMLGDATVTIGGAADVYSLALVLRNVLDPSLITPAESSAQAFDMLKKRAEEPARLSKRRDLRFLAPHFRRWLSDDPQERPTAAELATELQVLTAPEDLRSARLRFLRRALPWLVLLGLIIGGLTLQLRQKETALVVQTQALKEQRQIEEELRRKAAAQLDQLERSAETLGNERRLLRETLALARRLDAQVKQAVARTEGLERQRERLVAERDELVRASARAAAEREQLEQAKRALSVQRTTLLAERDQLSGQVKRLGAEKASAVREREQLKDVARGFERRIEALTQERARLEREAKDADARRAELSREQAASVAKEKALQRELDRQQTEVQRLKRRGRELQPRAQPGTKKAAVGAANKKRRPGARPKRR